MMDKFKVTEVIIAPSKLNLNGLVAYAKVVINENLIINKVKIYVTKGVYYVIFPNELYNNSIDNVRSVRRLGEFRAYIQEEVVREYKRQLTT